MGQAPSSSYFSSQIESAHAKAIGYDGATAAKVTIDPINNYNFAVCGQSGTGKSSLINAILSVEDSHPFAAKVGETETTEDVRRYCHPVHRFIKLWDLPGAGTTRHPTASYVQDKFLVAFDCVLICIDTRTTEIVGEIISEMKRNNIRVGLVRNKADEALKSLSRRDNTKSKSEHISKIILEFQNSVSHFNVRSFVVSTWNWQSGVNDFQELELKEFIESSTIPKRELKITHHGSGCSIQ
jgi:predicted GTPase